MLLFGSVHNGGVTICLLQGSASQFPVYVPKKDKFFRGVFLISVKDTLVMFVLTSGKRDLSPWTAAFEGRFCTTRLHHMVHGPAYPKMH